MSPTSTLRQQAVRSGEPMSPPPLHVAVARVLFDVPSTAAYLDTTERHVRNMVYNRRIPFVKVGALLRFRQADLDGWIAANTTPAGAA